MSRRAALALAAAILGPVVGCGSGDGGAGGSGGGGDDALLVFCFDENNRYRAMAGKDGFQRSKALEDFAAEGARIDGEAREAHKHFKMTMGGGIAFAENEIPWWRSVFGDTRTIIATGIRKMWDEGPGDDFAKHGHYLTIVGKYTQLGCGISIQGDETTVTMDYK